MAKRPTAGAMRDRLKLQRRADGPKVGGVVKKDWADIGQPFAAQLEARLGGEEVTAARLSGREIWQVTVRNCEQARSITADDRLVDARDVARTFAITSPPVDLNGSRQWLTFLAERGRTDG